MNLIMTSSMKQIFTLLAAYAFALSAHAQPTLTFATNAPTIGTQYTLNYGNYVAPGNAGAMQNWDLSTLASDSMDVLQMVAPSSTPNGSQFLNATIAEISEPVITYYQISPGGIHFAGSDDGTSIIVNSPMPKYLQFPCTMGSSWTTSHASEFTYEGDPVFRSGVITCEADGYGTLTMPSGTIQNVLRIHMLNQLQDSMAMFTIDYTYDSYLYYIVGQSYPIAELVTGTIDMGFGAPTVVQFSRWTGDITTNINVIGGHELRVYPNPANDAVNVVLPDEVGADAIITITDASGRSVHQERLTTIGGNIARLALQHLVRGLYTLVITDGKGERMMTRLSKL
jgi:hypothetical protein